MKKLLIASIVFFSFNKAANGQTNIYHPFPDTDAVWNVAYYDKLPGGSCFYDIHSYNRSYIQQGDTIINAVAYNKLYLNEQYWIYSTIQPPPCMPFDTYPGSFTFSFIGGLRNDSINKRVYYYSVQYNKECLLYDFDLAVGDSIGHWEDNCFNVNGSIPITSIDSVLVGSQYHKAFNYNGMFFPTIVEGMGGLTGLLEPYLYAENWAQLNCFSVLEQPLYPNSSSPCGIVSVEEIKSHNSFSISPNPFSTHTTVQVASYEIRNTSYEVEMYDVFGRIVKQFVIRNSSFVIERGDLPSGLYFIRLTTPSPSGEGWGEVIATEKLVITDN